MLTGGATPGSSDPHPPRRGVRAPPLPQKGSRRLVALRRQRHSVSLSRRLPLHVPLGRHLRPNPPLFEPTETSVTSLRARPTVTPVRASIAYPPTPLYGLLDPGPWINSGRATPMMCCVLFAHCGGAGSASMLGQCPGSPADTSLFRCTGQSYSVTPVQRNTRYPRGLGTRCAAVRHVSPASMPGWRPAAAFGPCGIEPVAHPPPLRKRL